jgi:long-chain acyl-CoA synthetase
MSRTEIEEAERLRAAERASAATGVERWHNLVSMFFDQAERLGDRAFLHARHGGVWQATTWAESARTVARIAEALVAMGVKPGERVVIVSENRPEFCLADLGIMAAGAVTVPTYTTNTVSDHRHILDNSGAVAAIVSTPKLARVVAQAASASAACRTLICIEPSRIAQTGDVSVLEWDNWLAGQPGDVAAARRRVASLGRSDLACLIYTSGTGGAPRGVRQHHGAILHNVAGAWT